MNKFTELSNIAMKILTEDGKDGTVDTNKEMAGKKPDDTLEAKKKGMFKKSGPDAAAKGVKDPVEAEENLSPCKENTKPMKSIFDEFFAKTMNEAEVADVPSTDPVEGQFDDKTGDLTPGGEGEFKEEEETVDVVTRLRMILDDLTELVTQIEGGGEEEVAAGEPAPEGGELGVDSGEGAGAPPMEAVEVNATPVELGKTDDMTEKGKMDAKGVKVKKGSAKIPPSKKAEGSPKEQGKSEFGPDMSMTAKSSMKAGKDVSFLEDE